MFTKGSITPKTNTLTHIFNLSLYSGTIPPNLKTAKVTPLYKSGDTIKYRPISVLTFSKKVLEKIVFERLDSYVLKNISSDDQHSFRPNSSTPLVIVN